MTESTRSPIGLLFLPRLRVQNANAISSPLTWGFPSPTAFLGLVHALERRLAQTFGREFDGVGIVCHSFEAQTFKPNRRQHLVFTQSRNPVYLKRDAAKFIADGTPAAIVEEGRAHLMVSLVIAVHGEPFDEQDGQDFAEAAYEVALGLRLAGGSVLPAPHSKATQPEWVSWPWLGVDQPATFARLRRRLLPGFALVHRPDLLAQRLAELKAEGNAASILDALLDLVRLNHVPTPNTAATEKASEEAADQPPNPAAEPDVLAAAQDARVTWQVQTRPGWLVPLPVGYAGLSDLYAPGQVANARDATTPFRFVESLYSLGQWVAPHRLPTLESLLWHSTAVPDAGLYRCVNRYADTLPNSESDNFQGD
ncbi:MAG: type I-F CRISPR-associated protein Csy2 [Candidatus Competibacteraceae bacterium]|nr:type I-F CRISPR-associated protein Csy2 [Candidatus Competibacteraceae bacterium]